MYPEIQVGRRRIGRAHPAVVIAEIGINHEGSIDVAVEIADSAISAGAEIIKHQTHVVWDEMSHHARNVIPGNADVSIYEIMERCALGEDDERALMQHVVSRGCEFISTPFSRAAADRLNRFNIPAYKIGSGECNNYPLIQHVAKFGRPVILSTGMNDIPSIAKAVQLLRSAGVPYALLHCTNIYPCPDDVVRLECLDELAEAFPDAVIGLSDHGVDNLACVAALARGASVVERHFVDSRVRPGPDVPCSMDEDELRQLISVANRTHRMLKGGKGPHPGEARTIAFAFASVVAIKDIAAGDVLDESNIWVKRPGSGDFLARDYDQLLGRRARNPVGADEQLKREDVDGY